MIPEFMKKYYDGSDSQGREAISKLAASYEDERRLFFETTFNEKQAFQRDWNKLTGEHKELTHTEAIAPMDHIYEERAREIAKGHGYNEQSRQNEVPPEQVKAEPKKPEECKNVRQEFLDNLEAMRQRQQEMRPKL